MSSDRSEYTTSDADTHENAKRVITNTLLMEARGRDNAISSQRLADRCGVSASTVRDLVPVVMREFGVPIGSGQGYFVIECEGEAVRQVERLVGQARTSLVRAGSVRRAFDWDGDA